MIQLLAFFLSFQAHALPLPRGITHVSQLPATFGESYDFEGIVKLDNCSGSLVRLEGARDTDRALVLTNGHCLESGFPAPGTFVYKRNSSRTFTVLGHRAERLGTVTATQVLYGTMTKTDMSIYKLRETYADIQSRFNVRALTLASTRPDARLAIDVVSGYWSRGYSCTLDRFVPTLKEDEYTWSDSLRYTQPGCETIGGTSGSPVIARGTRTVVGVNNTGNEDGDRCSMNNPCEVDENGNVTFEQGASYGQQTFWVYSCLDRAGELDITQAGCQLPH